MLIKAVAAVAAGMRKWTLPPAVSDALQSCRVKPGVLCDDRVLAKSTSSAHAISKCSVRRYARPNRASVRARLLSAAAPPKGDRRGAGTGHDAEVRSCLRGRREGRPIVSYVGAGTVEFIADASEGLRADRIWFMEMNTASSRASGHRSNQGQDLVNGNCASLPASRSRCAQPQLAIDGWAMEARLYAENPKQFPASPGHYSVCVSTGVRIDSGVDEAGSFRHYDPMIAKLITPARRATAQLRHWQRPAETYRYGRSRRTRVSGTYADASRFLAGEIDTGLSSVTGESAASATLSKAVLQAVASAMLSVDSNDPWCALTGFRVAGPPERRVRVELAGGPQVIELTRSVFSNALIADVGDVRVVFMAGEAWQFGPERADSGPKGSAGDGTVVSPMPGVVAAVNVRAGDAVTRGQRLLVVEAMKMEHALLAPFAGTVASLHAEVGQHVAEGALLARVETK